MPPQINDIKRRLLSTIAGFSLGQKVVSAVAVMAVLFGFMTFGSWASKPSMTPLFTNLEPSDAAAITQKLTSQHVPFKLADGGATVMVPRSDVYQLRINLSSAGLPTGGNQGYSILDKQGITTSEFRQRVDFQRAMEGELAKTIGAIDGVQGATVHLVIPQDDIFANDSRHPSAAVMVKTAPGKGIAPGSVQGIVHLISSSVEGLDPTQVTVTDSKGIVLAAPGEDGTDSTAGDAHNRQTKAFNDELAGSIQEMLAAALGPGHAVVRVNADLDFDQKAISSETYDTSKPGAVVGESSSKESFIGAGQSATGILGQGAVTPTTGTGTGGASGNGNYAKEDAQTSRAVSKVTEQVKAAPGRVTHMSVAVLLDSGTKGLDKAKISGLVSAAAGIKVDRGDAVAVDEMAFDTSAADTAKKEIDKAQAATKTAGMMSIARTAIVLLIVGAVVLILMRKASKAMPKRTPILIPADLAELPPAGGVLTQDRRSVPRRHEDRSLDRSEDRVLAGVGSHSLSGGGDSGALLPGTVGRHEVESEITNLIERQPEEVAELLRNWLADRRE